MIDPISLAWQKDKRGKMSIGTSIEWTDATWSPVTGCTRVSAGCDHCYSARMTHRLEMMGQEKYRGLTVVNPKGDRHFNGVVKTHEAVLAEPLKWKKPRRIFVNSMSDTFHREVPFEFIDRIFAVAALCPQHTFQILTKRPERTAEYLKSRSPSIFQAAGDWPVMAVARKIAKGHGSNLVNEAAVIAWPLPNLWLGTSVEDQARADERIPHLLRCPAAIHFISAEPLLGPVDFSRWIGYKPIHENKLSNGSAGVCSCNRQGVRNRRSGKDLAAGETRMEPMEANHGMPTVQTNKSREQDQPRILTDSNDGRQGAGAGGRSPDCLPTFQRANTGRNDDQSQERREGRQQTREFRVGDVSRAANSRPTCAESGADEPERREECDEQAECRSGSRDQAQAVSGGETCEHCGGLRSDRQDSIKNRHRPPLDQIIVGGESGPGARPMHPNWARSIRNQCQSAGVPFFFKQGSQANWQNFKEFSSFPKDLQVREFPIRKFNGDLRA